MDKQGSSCLSRSGIGKACLYRQGNLSLRVKIPKRRDRNNAWYSGEKFGGVLKLTGSEDFKKCALKLPEAGHEDYFTPGAVSTDDAGIKKQNFRVISLSRWKHRKIAGVRIPE